MHRIKKLSAPVAKLVDAPDLGSGVERRVGSSPIRRTMRQKRNFTTKNSSFFCCKIDNASSKRSREAQQNVVPLGLGFILINCSIIVFLLIPQNSIGKEQILQFLASFKRTITPQTNKYSLNISGHCCTVIQL